MRKYNADVVSLPVEFDREKIDSIFRLVIAVIKRSKELHEGAMPRVTTKAQKATTIALVEVVSGSMHVLTGEAAKKAEGAGSLNYKKIMDEAEQKESLPEDKSELEKDLEVYLRKKTENRH